MTERLATEAHAADAREDPLPRICGEIASAIRRVWGRGPVKTTAHWAGPNMLVVLLADGHTDQEKALRAAGHDQPVLESRGLLREMLEQELTTIVEQVTHREVTTMLSATRLDPDLSAEIFLLEPARIAEDVQSMAQRAIDAGVRAEELAHQTRAVQAQSQQAHLKVRERRSRGT